VAVPSIVAREAPFSGVVALRDGLLSTSGPQAAKKAVKIKASATRK
jgi:hypothetical protein